jgi:hypothetical protein
METDGETLELTNPFADYWEKILYFAKNKSLFG